jgi:hypothetical protein
MDRRYTRVIRWTELIAGKEWGGTLHLMWEHHQLSWPVVAVTGLGFEARIAGSAAVIDCGLRNSALLRAIVARGCRGIISFGVAGGLAPGLPPGGS